MLHSCFPTATIIYPPSVDKSAFSRTSGSRQLFVRTLWSPRPKRVILRRQAHTQVAGLLTVVLVTNLETVLSRCGLGYSPVWPWSCRQHSQLRDPGGVMPACSSGNRPIGDAEGAQDWVTAASGSTASTKSCFLIYSDISVFYLVHLDIDVQRDY